jgi:2-hydroxychromene-2-carboxylate isomerase
MRALAYARMLGKTVAFAQALLRQAYAAGRALGERDTLFLAGAAAEIHPRALVASLGQAGTRRAVAETVAAARAAGVTELPALLLPGGGVHQGPDCLELALRCAPATPTA